MMHYWRKTRKTVGILSIYQQQKHTCQQSKAFHLLITKHYQNFNYKHFRFLFNAKQTLRYLTNNSIVSENDAKVKQLPEIAVWCKKIENRPDFQIHDIIEICKNLKLSDVISQNLPSDLELRYKDNGNINLIRLEIFCYYFARALYQSKNSINIRGEFLSFFIFYVNKVIDANSELEQQKNLYSACFIVTEYLNHFVKKMNKNSTFATTEHKQFQKNYAVGQSENITLINCQSDKFNELAVGSFILVMFQYLRSRNQFGLASSIFSNLHTHDLVSAHNFHLTMLHYFIRILYANQNSSLFDVDNIASKNDKFVYSNQAEEEKLNELNATKLQKSNVGSAGTQKSMNINEEKQKNIELEIHKKIVLDILYKIFTVDNTAASICYRQKFLSSLSDKLQRLLVIEYSRKMMDNGWLIGTRGFTCYIESFAFKSASVGEILTPLPTTQNNLETASISNTTQYTDETTIDEILHQMSIERSRAIELGGLYNITLRLTAGGVERFFNDKENGSTNKRKPFLLEFGANSHTFLSFMNLPVVQIRNVPYNVAVTDKNDAKTILTSNYKLKTINERILNKILNRVFIHNNKVSIPMTVVFVIQSLLLSVKVLESNNLDTINNILNYVHANVVLDTSINAKPLGVNQPSTKLDRTTIYGLNNSLSVSPSLDKKGHENIDTTNEIITMNQSAWNFVHFIAFDAFILSSHYTDALQYFEIMSSIGVTITSNMIEKLMILNLLTNPELNIRLFDTIENRYNFPRTVKHVEIFIESLLQSQRINDGVDVFFRISKQIQLKRNNDASLPLQLTAYSILSRLLWLSRNSYYDNVNFFELSMSSSTKLIDNPEYMNQAIINILRYITSNTLPYNNVSVKVLFELNTHLKECHMTIRDLLMQHVELVMNENDASRIKNLKKLFNLLRNEKIEIIQNIVNDICIRNFFEKSNIQSNNMDISERSTGMDLENDGNEINNEDSKIFRRNRRSLRRNERSMINDSICNIYISMVKKTIRSRLESTICMKKYQFIE